MLPGGVCAVLDYEVSQMTDYVAEMAQRLCNPNPNSPVSPAFRKFVSGILTSTRLPKATILLGLNYLARRIHVDIQEHGPFKASDGQIWRMLTIGLLLGSKFLDDNTFQNRSWSEVSGIPVAELNKMEQDWLKEISWSLFVNLEQSKDYKAWIQSWDEWCEVKKVERTHTLERITPLAPIDTNVQRVRPYSQNYSAYTKTPSREHSGFRPAYDQSSWITNSYPTPLHTPPSAPDSGLNTPEYMSATGGGPRFNDWALFNQYSRGYQGPNHIPYVSQPHVAAYHTPVYSNHYGHYNNIWDHSAVDCNCGSCIPHAKHQQYFMGHGYGQQVVA